MPMPTQSRDSVEFYDGRHRIGQVLSSIVPPVGAKISIRNQVWTVRRVTYALDQADNQYERGMRANVDVVVAD